MTTTTQTLDTTMRARLRRIENVYGSKRQRALDNELSRLDDEIHHLNVDLRQLASEEELEAIEAAGVSLGPTCLRAAFAAVVVDGCVWSLTAFVLLGGLGS